MNIIREAIYRTIDEERIKQDAEWGANRKLDYNLWTTIIGEEVGEVNRAILEKDYKNMIHELIQTAAVVIAFIESEHKL